MQEKVTIGGKILGYVLGAIGFFIAFGVFLEISPMLLGFKKIGGGFFVAMLFALLSIWIIWKSSKVAKSVGTISAWSFITSMACFGQYINMKSVSVEKIGREAKYYAGMADLSMGAGVALILLIIIVSVIANKRTKELLPGTKEKILAISGIIFVLFMSFTHYQYFVLIKYGELGWGVLLPWLILLLGSSLTFLTKILGCILSIIGYLMFCVYYALAGNDIPLLMNSYIVYDLCIFFIIGWIIFRTKVINSQTEGSQTERSRLHS